MLRFMGCGVALALVVLPSACDVLNLGPRNVRVSIISPEAGATYGPGDTVELEIAVENFSLIEPDSAKRYNAHPTGDDPLGIDDDHDHPAGTAGHYHIYLDDADGDDPHVTAYSTKVSYVLPDDLSEGTHTIRVTLRNHDHTPLSDSCEGCTTDATVEIECVQP